MKACWFEVDGDTYYVDKNEPYFITTGYAHYIKNYPNEDDLRSYLFDDNGVLQKDYTGPADVVINGVEKTIFFKNGERYDDSNGKSPYGLHEGTDGYYYYVKTWEGEIAKNESVSVNKDRAHGLVPAGTYTFDAQGRLSSPSILEVENNYNISYTVIGRVVTVAKDAPVCKVCYWDETSEKNVALEATVNTDGSYNFAAPSDVGEVVIILAGDADGNGNIKDTDIAKMKETVLSGNLSLDSLNDVAADVNGDGRVTAADIARLNATLLGKTNIEW